MKTFAIIAVLAVALAVCSAAPAGWAAKMRAQQQPAPMLDTAMRRTGSSGTTPSGTTPSDTTPTGAPTAAGSGTTPTAAPTAALTAGAGGSTITQVVTVTDIASATAYTPTVATAYNRAFGVAAGVWNTTVSNDYSVGCSVSSTATNSARRGVDIAYSMIVSAALNDIAVGRVSDVTTMAATMQGSMQAIIDADSALANVPIMSSAPTVQPAQTTPGTSGSASLAASWCLAAGVALLALRH